MALPFEFQNNIENIVTDDDLVEEYTANNQVHTMYLLVQCAQILYFYEVDEEPVCIEILWHIIRSKPVINYMGRDYFVNMNEEHITLRNVLTYIGIDNSIMEMDPLSNPDYNVNNILGVFVEDLPSYDAVQLCVYRNQTIYADNVPPPLIDDVQRVVDGEAGNG
jgi:hypothetical protein